MTLEDGQKRAKELGILFKETSAKSGTNVKELFEDIAHSLPGLNDPPTEQPGAQSMKPFKFKSHFLSDRRNFNQC